MMAKSMEAEVVAPETIRRHASQERFVEGNSASEQRSHAGGTVPR